MITLETQLRRDKAQGHTTDLRITKEECLEAITTNKIPFEYRDKTFQIPIGTTKQLNNCQNLTMVKTATETM